jgi:hypothetical protein
MADDPNPPLSAALVAARAILGPQIRGLSDLAATSVSPELRAKLQEVLAARQHRDQLIIDAMAARDAYINALNELEGDGYPALPHVGLLASLLKEIREENADLAAASAIFSDDIATTMTIGLSEPAAKPTE